jgi:hypothetical protein
MAGREGAGGALAVDAQLSWCAVDFVGFDLGEVV